MDLTDLVLSWWTTDTWSIFRGDSSRVQCNRGVVQGAFHTITVLPIPQGKVKSDKEATTDTGFSFIISRSGAWPWSLVRLSRGTHLLLRASQQQTTKFDYIVASLSPEYATEVCDLMMDPSNRRILRQHQEATNPTHRHLWAMTLTAIIYNRGARRQETLTTNCGKCSSTYRGWARPFTMPPNQLAAGEGHSARLVDTKK